MASELVTQLMRFLSSPTPTFHHATSVEERFQQPHTQALALLYQHLCLAAWELLTGLLELDLAQQRLVLLTIFVEQGGGALLRQYARASQASTANVISEAKLPVTGGLHLRDVWRRLRVLQVETKPNHPNDPTHPN